MRRALWRSLVQSSEWEGSYAPRPPRKRRGRLVGINWSKVTALVGKAWAPQAADSLFSQSPPYLRLKRRRPA